MSGFLEPRRMSPTGLAVVVTMHVAALGALALVKGPEFLAPDGRMKMYHVPVPPAPDPEPEPRTEPREAEQPSVLDSLPPVIDLPLPRPLVRDPPLPPLPPLPRISEETVPEPVVEPPVPIRVEARLDPRYAGDLQPPYPPSELRSEREGRVRVSVTIGTDGRVKAVRRLSATSDAFFEATRRHALARWRFRPATEDGRPVESRKVMNLLFRIDG